MVNQLIWSLKKMNWIKCLGDKVVSRWIRHLRDTKKPAT